MHATLSPAALQHGRFASWFRKDYPRHAPGRGHSYLIALCGVDAVAR